MSKITEKCSPAPTSFISLSSSSFSSSHSPSLPTSYSSLFFYLYFSLPFVYSSPLPIPYPTHFPPSPHAIFSVPKKVTLYRVIQKESSIFSEVQVSVIVRKKVHMKMCLIDYTLITNLMHWLLFIHKILFSSKCFEHQVLIFRRT